MAKAARVTELSEGDLLDLDLLRELVAEHVAPNSTRFSVRGSVLDYIVDDYASVLSCDVKDEGVSYEVDLDWPDEFPEDKETQELSRLTDTFLRAGIVTHSNLDEVMSRLRTHDDVIIGIDTNVLWDCILTSFLIEEIYKEDFPNWILISVPKLVMAETENAANNTFGGGDHPRLGWPQYKGRVGQRGLQEVMDIRERDPDRPGIAMMTVGDMNFDGVDVNRSNWQLDALIRNQFQDFLEDIRFHKGTYFLSQDRVNVMMSGTEGAEGLYLQKPDLTEFESGTIPFDTFTRLVYELCIQFGAVQLCGDDSDFRLELEIFWAGKHVADWQSSRMQVTALEL